LPEEVVVRRHLVPNVVGVVLDRRAQRSTHCSPSLGFAALRGQRGEPQPHPVSAGACSEVRGGPVSAPIPYSLIRRGRTWRLRWSDRCLRRCERAR
jgi:hypothetical protein